MNAAAPLNTDPDSDIVVRAFSTRFHRAFAKLLKEEGGFVDHPHDRGGATNHGISLRFLKVEGKLDLDEDGIADFDLDMDGDIDGRDIRELTIGDAKYLYHRCFWRVLDCDILPMPIGEMVFDQAVNGGAVAAVKTLQRAINYPGMPAIAVDGVIGQQTYARIDALVKQVGMVWIVQSYRDAVKHRYRGIVKRSPSQAVFLDGWINRANRLGVM